jgi:tetratricopeptide (TPR) repeat protein
MQQANERYRSGDYQAAKEAYRDLIDRGYRVKELFYNLGNACYKTEDWAGSVLNYERALVLAPRDRETRENLVLAKQQLAGEIIQLEVFPLITTWQNLRNTFSANTWTWLGLLCFWVGGLGLVFWLLAPTRRQRKRGFFVGLIALFLSVLPFTLAYGRKQAILHPHKAVVMENSVPLRATPSEGSESLYTLFAGATVNQLDSLEGWHKVSLANGYQGWVDGSKLTLIW